MTKGPQMHAPKRKLKRPKTLKGWVFYILFLIGFRGARTRMNASMEVEFKRPVYDVEAYKNYTKVFQEGEFVVVTEKIHGSNARFLFLDGVLYAGSRNQWKAPDSGCAWRKALADNPWIPIWCQEHPGATLYGEIAPTQKGYTYGTKGNVKFFLFDILAADGNWVSYAEWEDYDIGYEDLHDIAVPFLYYGVFDADHILKMVDGPSEVPGASHRREGIVIKSIRERRVVGLGRAQLKVVSNAFLEKDNK